MNGKQTVIVDKIKFSNVIAVVSLLLFLNYGVVSIEASILLIVQDEEDKDLFIKAFCLFFYLFFQSILIGFLLNPEKGSDSSTITMYVLLIHYVEAFSTILYLAHEEGKKYLQSDLHLIID